MLSKPVIYLDSREARFAFAKKMEEHYDVKYMALSGGDIMILKESGAIFIEHMSILDFLGKVRDGRIWQQIEKMKLLTDDYWIVIEKMWMLKKFTQWNEKSVVSLISAIAEHNRVMVSNRDDWLIYLIDYLHKKHNVERDVKLVEVKAKLPNMSFQQMVAYSLTSIQGIGQSTSVKLFKRFGSLNAIANASVTELSEIVREEIAQRIYNTYHYDMAKFLEDQKS